MDQIRLYKKICEIGLDPRQPINQPTMKKIMFNLNELEMYYNDRAGFYSKKPTKVIGGNEPNVIMVSGGSEDILKLIN